MSEPYSKLPAGGVGTAKPFEVAIPQSDLDLLHTLLKHSRLAPLNYENTQEDRRLGITRKWLEDARTKWQNDFDWSARLMNNCGTRSDMLSGVNMRVT